MAAGETTVTGTIVRGSNDTAGGHFGNVHVATNNVASLGAIFKLGLPIHGYWTFTIPELPPNAKVTKAFLRMVAVNAGSGFNYAAVLRCIKRDARWNKEKRDGWSRIAWSDFRLQVFDSTGTKKLETVPAADLDSYRRLRPVGGESAGQLGQSWRNTTGTNYVLGSATFHLRKVGSPVGEIGIQVWQDYPSGAKDFWLQYFPNPLAVSSGIDVATVSGGTGGDVTFTFHGPNQITIVSHPWLRWYIVTITGSYTFSDTDCIGVNVDANAGYGGGVPLISGVGRYYDIQNYPAEGNLPWTGDANKVLGSEVVWITPNMVTGGTYETGDLSLIIQEAINDPGYAEDGNILGLNWDSQDAGPGDLKTIAQYEHPTYNPVELVVVYKPRRVHTT